MPNFARPIVLLTLAVLLFSSTAQAQREFETIRPEGVLATHRPGVDVEPPSPADVAVISNHGDTMVLQYTKTIPSHKRALDHVSIYYRYTVGDETARVIYRETSTRVRLYFSVGADDIVSMKNLYKPDERRADVDSFASMDVQALHEKHPLMRYPTPLTHGVLYQLAVKDDHSKPGPIYYAPRNWREYQLDKAVRLADKDFLELGIRPHNNELIQSNDHYVVLISKGLDKARVLDLETMKVRAFALTPPEGSGRWAYDPVLIDETHLMIQHTLYELATGKRVAARDQDPGKRRTYLKPHHMHDGVCYGVTREITYDDKKQRIESDRLWARPALDDGTKARTIVSNTTGLGFIAGEGGLVYTEGKQWTKTDWLKTDDFEQAQAE